MTAALEQDQGGWVPDDSSFGARLALVRQRMGWGNVKEAALACGVPVESWRNWERDGARPRSIVEVASRISERTGADFYWLLAGPRRGVGKPTVGSFTRAPLAHPDGFRQTVPLRGPMAA